MEKLINLKELQTIETHDGVFHLDEVFVVSLLESILDRALEVIRSNRNNEVSYDDTKLVVDIFGGRYDHHKEEKFDGDRKLSSAGLVWKDIKSNFAEKFGLNENYLKPMDVFVKQVDAMDNGSTCDTQSVTPLNVVISQFNSVDIRNNDSSFRDAVEFIKLYISKLVDQCKLESQRGPIWDSKEVINGMIIKLNGFVPDWEDRAKKENLSSIDFIVRYEEHTNTYAIQRSRTCNTDLNKVLNIELDKDKGEFIHLAGFMAKVGTDKIDNVIDIITKYTQWGQVSHPKK